MDSYDKYRHTEIEEEPTEIVPESDERRVSRHEVTGRREESVREYTEDMWLERKNKIFKINSIIWLVIGVIEFIIGLRILLLLFAANPDNPFAEFIYNLSYVFVWPFLGLFETPTADGSVLETSSIIAMVVYLLIGWLITKIVDIVMTPSEAREMRTLHRH